MSIGKRQHKAWLITGVAMLGLLLVPATLLALNIDATNKYAWGENIGWLNFGTTEGDVDVSATAIDGYAWGENVGWISLTCENTSSCGTVNYGISLTDVSSTTKEASGYAWGANVGWISFACENTSSCATVDYGVELDRSTGIFSGYAWGENVGWVVLNCSTTSSCGTVDYKVATSATITPTPAAVPPGLLGPPPTTTASPTATPTTTPTVTPTASPTPIPTVTPTVTPPLETPTASPQPTPPIQSPMPQPIELLGRGIDAVASFVFKTVAGSVADACDDNIVQAGACAATGAGAVAVTLAIVAMLVQQEAAAASFSLLQVFGLKKRARVWGTIYDSRTKRPIPMARTELLDTSGRVLETRYADRDGRYGFLLSPSQLHGGKEVQISIHVRKPGYRFPSGLAVTGTDYFVYDRLYQGGAVTVRSDSVLNFNVPMDPVGETRASFSGFGRSLTGPLIERILNVGFYIGLVLVPLNLYLVPDVKNLVILVLFFGVNLFRLLAHYRPYGKTVDAATGKSLPFALVILNEPDGRRAAFSVSDEYGRYILSAGKNHEYELVAHTPANIQPQRQTTQHIRTRSGWLTDTIQVGKDTPAPPSQPAATPSMTLPVLLFLFAIGFSTGRPRSPIGTIGEGVDEAYVLMYPHVASLSSALQANSGAISLLAVVAITIVLAGTVLAARKAFMNWLRGRRGGPPAWTRTMGVVAFLVGAITVPMAYLFNPTAGRALLGIIFLAASALWARTIRNSRVS